jgi:hypothetical protein
MKSKLACLSLAAFACAACDKSETKAKPEHTSSRQPGVETRADAPTIAEQTAPAPSDAPDAGVRIPTDPPLAHPVSPAMIRPAGTTPDDTSWETLTAEQKVGKLTSNGIARMPKDISDKILADATKTGAPEDQLNLITRQAAAWHHINRFREDSLGIPDHMRMALLDKLATKHGDSWMNMVPELDEQVSASAKVSELRDKGIPGLSPDESQELIINAIDKYGADYKAILAVAEQSAKK